jgi:hypothetical protein
MEIYKSLANRIDRSINSGFLLFRFDLFINRYKKNIKDGIAIIILVIIIIGTTIILFG